MTCCPSSLRSAPVFAMVAGESSGDTLGAGLMHSLRKIYPDARFFGIGGPQMLAQGFESLFPMERLSVMGLVEVVGRLPELLKIRRKLSQACASADVFVGIDAPDFNLSLAAKLRASGLATLQYVSPSVWAWRQGRVKKIRRAVDHVLCLLPFETAIYDQHGVAATFVGHPLADAIPLESTRPESRRKLGYSDDVCLAGILPGSRGSEIKRLGPLFIEVMKRLLEKRPDMRFVLPCINPQRFQQVQALLQESGQGLPVQILEGSARDAMAASDALLVASGTATLEGLLHKKPMVVSYKLNPLTYWLVKKLMRTRRVALPNLLAGRDIVPELLQEEASPQALTTRMLEALDTGLNDSSGDFISTCTRIHHELRCQASDRAAGVIVTMLSERGWNADCGR